MPRTRHKSVARDALSLPDVSDDAELGALPLVFQTLGAARLVVGVDRVLPSTGTLFALLVRVAYSPEYRIPRDVLGTSLWPEQSLARQRGNLRQMLYKARAMGINVSLIGDSVCLDPQQIVPTFSLSQTTALFDQDVVRGQEPFGLFLPSVSTPWREMQEWIEGQRATVHAGVRRVLVEQLRARRERADWSGAESLARWLLQFDPLHEEATLTVAECTMLAGSKAEAVAILDQYLAEIGPSAGDIRLPATLLRKRFTEPATKKRPAFAPPERHFVGRTSELAHLTMAMRRARWHDGSAVMIEGPAGIGKSRLARELSKVATIEGFREIRVECRDGNVHRPFHALLEAITDLLALPGAIGCAPESMSVLRKIAGISETFVSEVESDDSAAESAATEQHRIDFSRIRSQSVSHAVIDLIGAVAVDKPLFLVIDDAHWIDDDSWNLLVDLAESASLIRVFLMITTRPPARRLDSSSKSAATLHVMKLHALSPEESLSLTRWLSHEMLAPLSPEAEDWIVSASEGSPFFLLALMNHWAETGDAGGIPPTLQSLLDHRIERLPSAAVRALQTIALLGQFASLDRIKESLQLQTHELLVALEQLEKEGYLARDEASLVVSHDLVGKAATNRLSPLVRAALRSSIADAFEREFETCGRNDALLQALHHTDLSGRHDAVLRLLMKYADVLVDCESPRALIHIINRLEPSRILPAISPTIRRLQARLALESGEYAKSLALGPSGLLLSERVSDLSDESANYSLSVAHSASRADPYIDRYELSRGVTTIARSQHLSRATRLRAAEIAIVIAANNCDEETAYSCYSAFSPTEMDFATNERAQRVAILYHTIFGSLDTATACARALYTRAVSMQPSPGGHQDAVRAAFALRLCGHATEATHAFQDSYRIAIELDLPRLAQFPVWQLANMALEVGDRKGAAEWTNILAELFKSDEDPISSSFVVGFECRSAIFHGDHDAALNHFERFQRSHPRFPPIKAATYLIALELGVRLLIPEWMPSEAFLAVAKTRFEATARFGTSDFFSAVYCEALLRVGRKSEAERTLSTYLREIRRDRSTPAINLIALATSLGIDPSA
jgi:DNA-binding SARP family transcriptional activator